MDSVSSSELGIKVEEEKPQRDNSLEREYWRKRDGFWREYEIDEIPEFLYHRTHPSKVKSILRKGLLPEKYLEGFTGKKVVYLGDNPSVEDDNGETIVKINPDALDPGWISTIVGRDPDSEKSMWGNVWMHVGPIPKEQIAEIKWPSGKVLKIKPTSNAK